MKRHRRSAQEWRTLIEQQRDSGLPVAAFCMEHGLCSTAFYTWRRRFRTPGTDIAQFVRLEPSCDSQSSGTWMTLTTPSGFRLECNGSTDAQRIAEVLAVLDRGARGC